MRRFLLGAVLLYGWLLPAQPAFQQLPLLWLRADSASLHANIWRDVSGKGHHARFSGAMPAGPLSRMNFQPCFTLSGGDHFAVSGLWMPQAASTTIVVFRTADTLPEQGLWEMRTDSSVHVGLTSHRIVGQNSSFTYTSRNADFPVVNSLFQGWNGKSGKDSSALFRLGACDSLHYEGQLAECLLFGGSLADSLLLRYISYLAVKYGITLYKTDYTDSRGEVFWHYKPDSLFCASIAGVGRDHTLGLYQKQTLLADGQMVVGIGNYATRQEDNGDTLAVGHYLMWGLDSMLLESSALPLPQTGQKLRVRGNGVLQARVADTLHYPTFVGVDASLWQGDPWQYVLCIDRSGSGEFRHQDCDLYPVSRVDSMGRIWFEQVLWDRDGNGRDRFCFRADFSDTDSLAARNLTQGDANRQAEHSGNEPDGGNTGRISSRYTLFPNPSRGDFTLQVTYPESSPVTVHIYTVRGKLMGSFSGIADPQYTLRGHIPAGGHYLIHIQGAGQRKTLKMIVH